MKFKLTLAALVLSAFLNLSSANASTFEGQIKVTLTRGSQTETLLYTVGTNQLRIERGENDRPYPTDIINLDTGDITLLFPNNRSFVRLSAASENQSPAFPGMLNPPGMPGMPMQPQPPAPAPNTIGPTNLPGMPGMPQMPPRPQIPQAPPGIGPQSGSSVPTMPNMGGMPMMMPPPMMDQPELKATTDTTNLLGYTCTRYEVRQHGEVMEIWAADKLLTFEPYLQNQPHRFGPRMIEEQWGGLLKAKHLFPLLAVLRFERPAMPGSNQPPEIGPERLRFEVTAITPQKITDAALFQPPPDYQEIQPLPF